MGNFSVIFEGCQASQFRKGAKGGTDSLWGTNSCMAAKNTLLSGQTLGLKWSEWTVFFILAFILVIVYAKASYWWFQIFIYNLFLSKTTTPAGSMHPDTISQLYKMPLFAYWDNLHWFSNLSSAPMNIATKAIIILLNMIFWSSSRLVTCIFRCTWKADGSRDTALRGSLAYHVRLF